MNISDAIEQMIASMLKDQSDSILLQRNSLANELGCVPSQINYVIQTRFTPERGYVVESKRGGGGGIRITKVAVSKNNYLMHILNNIGDEVSFDTATVFVRNFADYELITPREAKIMLSALSDASFPRSLQNRDRIRAVMLKNMLLSLMK